MKKIEQKYIYYQCEICGEHYEKEEDALECESIPVTQDKGVKIGDFVINAGGFCKVVDVKIFSRSDALMMRDHSDCFSYIHTICLKVIYHANFQPKKHGTTILHFDDYDIDFTNKGAK